MQGNPKIDPPVAGEDVRDLWKKVAELVEMHNRPWACKPDNTARFAGSKENVILDLAAGGNTDRMIVVIGGQFYEQDVLVSGSPSLLT